MARRLRIQYPGALYHVINRGSYRRDVFGSAGASGAFASVLAEASERHRWRIHAFLSLDHVRPENEFFGQHPHARSSPHVARFGLTLLRGCARDVVR